MGIKYVLLSDSEKEDLINALQEDVNDLQKRSDKIDSLNVSVAFSVMVFEIVKQKGL